MHPINPQVLCIVGQVTTEANVIAKAVVNYMFKMLNAIIVARRVTFKRNCYKWKIKKRKGKKTDEREPT